MSSMQNGVEAQRLAEGGNTMIAKSDKIGSARGMKLETSPQGFYTHKSETRTWHIQDIKFGGRLHNNKMERLNAEVRDRENVMRNLKRTGTPILTGYQIYHNDVRPHMALEAKTPAELCGIQVEGENKWLTIIQNAAHQTKGNSQNQPADQTPR